MIVIDDGDRILGEYRANCSPYRRQPGVGDAFVRWVHDNRGRADLVHTVSYIADPEKREHLLQDAVARVSEVLFRIANSVDLTGLSLEVDLTGVELAHAGEAREQGEVKKAS